MTKTISYLLLLMFMIASCSDDDSVTQDETLSEKLIGTWYVDKVIENGVEQDLDECFKESNVQFFENGTYNIEGKANNDDFTDCIIVTQSSGDWELIDNNTKLKFIEQGEENIINIDFEENSSGGRLISINDTDSETFITEYVKR